jgi:hypothetical protein
MKESSAIFDESSHDNILPQWHPLYIFEMNLILSLRRPLRSNANASLAKICGCNSDDDAADIFLVLLSK